MKDNSDNEVIATDADLINAGYITNELLPCPFCGNTQILTGGNKNIETGNVVYQVFCNNLYECNASMHCCIGGVETINEARKTVVERWNKRYNTQHK